MGFEVKRTKAVTSGECNVDICFKKVGWAFAIAPSTMNLGLENEYVWFCDYHSRYLAKALGYETEPEVYTVGCGRG